MFNLRFGFGNELWCVVGSMDNMDQARVRSFAFGLGLGA